MESIFREAEEALALLEVENAIANGIWEALGAVRKDENVCTQAGALYSRLFERAEPLGWEIAGEAEEDGLLYTAVLFARACWLNRQKSYLVSSGSLDFFSPLLRFLRRNYARHGHCRLLGSYRYWAYRYAFPRIFSLGRLVFEITQFSYPFEVYEADGMSVALAASSIRHTEDGVEGRGYGSDAEELSELLHLTKPRRLLAKGDAVLALHMPGNEKLSEEAVEQSLREGERFFAQYFSETDFKAYVCSSWLLDPGLKRFLSEDSNILRFQSRFRIAARAENTHALFQNIFNREEACPLEQLEPTNRFQQEVLDYVKNGGVLYSGRGYILK